jgi:hypothetical protein
LAAAFPVGAIVGIASDGSAECRPMEQPAQIERGFGDVATSASTVPSPAAKARTRTRTINSGSSVMSKVSVRMRVEVH